MKKFLLVICMAVLLCATQAMAQENVMKFSVKGSATTLKLTYRLNQVGDEEVLTFSNGETATIKQNVADKLETVEIPLKTALDDYEISMTASKVEVLRIISSKAVTGINHLASGSLKKLNVDYTKLTGSAKLDFSQCPSVEEITLNECEVTDVVLPDNPRLKTFQVSLPLFSTKSLKSLDLSKCTGLETLGLQGVSLDTIDLRACPGLKQLTLSGLSTKIHPKAMLGAKALKSLTLVNIKNCGLGFNDLPDLNETELENFVIKGLYFTYINRSCVDGMTVDLKHLAQAKGISETVQNTVFTWYQKVDGNWLAEPLNSSQVTEKDGVFTFSPSLLNADGEATVRCNLFNPGYPDVAYYKNGLMSSNVTLKAPVSKAIELTISNVSPGDDDEGYPIEEFDLTFQLQGAKGSVVSIDWGNGPQDYTITQEEPQQVSGTVDLGATIKIEGPITLLDASNSHVTGITFPAKCDLEILRLSRNKIMEINLSSLPQLKELMVSDNKLSSLDLTQLPLLEEVYCAWNNIPMLDFSKNTNLKLITCYNNQLSSLDVTMLPQLGYLVASDNNAIKAIDLSKNNLLKSLDLSNCGLSALTLATPVLEKLVVSGNQLATIDFSTFDELKNLYWLDVRKNQLNACVLNDVIFLVPEIADAQATEYRLFLAGNPGATAYDAELLPVAAGEGAMAWKVDVQGDGTGCETARIFGDDQVENGAAALKIADAQVPFGSQVKKGTNVVVTLTPDAGYAVDYVNFDGEALVSIDHSATDFALVVKHSGVVTYAFQQATGINYPFAGEIQVMRTSAGFAVAGLPAFKLYRVYTIDGKIISTGQVDAGGSMEVELSGKGVYVININGYSMKLIF